MVQIYPLLADLYVHLHCHMFKSVNVALAYILQIVITHNQALAPMADRLIHIKNGQVSHMETNENPMSIDEIEW